jgi:predicted S18 family serine protease
MTLTLQEIKEKLAEEYDEITLLEVLNINSFDLVDAFFERIEERYEYFNKELSMNGDNE